MSTDAPGTEIIPYLIYRDVPAALQWLGRAFGFVEELRHATPGGMHAQMRLNGRLIMLGQRREAAPAVGGAPEIGVFVYLPDVDAHFAQAHAAGATIVHPPTDLPYGRSYEARDPDGHTWYFTTPPGQGPEAETAR